MRGLNDAEKHILVEQAVDQIREKLGSYIDDHGFPVVDGEDAVFSFNIPVTVRIPVHHTDLDPST